MTTATDTLQTYIEAQQDADSIKYALRSIKTCGGVYNCTGPHAGQLVRGCQTATRLLGVITPNRDAATPWLLNEANGRAKEALKLAKSERGGRKQERLELAA